jgi:hypothetical protein
MQTLALPAACDGKLTARFEIILKSRGLSKRRVGNGTWWQAEETDAGDGV